jgi:hypothetical protein
VKLAKYATFCVSGLSSRVSAYVEGKEIFAPFERIWKGWPLYFPHARFGFDAKNDQPYTGKTFEGRLLEAGLFEDVTMLCRSRRVRSARGYLNGVALYIEWREWRDAFMHPTPRPAEGRDLLRQVAFFEISLDDLTELVDATISLITRIDAAPGGRFGRASVWLRTRGADSVFAPETLAQHRFERSVWARSSVPWNPQDGVGGPDRDRAMLAAAEGRRGMRVARAGPTSTGTRSPVQQQGRALAVSAIAALSADRHEWRGVPGLSPRRAPR